MSLHWKGSHFLCCCGFIRPNRGRSGAVSGMFLIGYGVFRSAAEFFREPDDGFMGVLTLGISMGQWLSLPMIVAGVIMIVWAYRTPSAPSVRETADKPVRPAARHGSGNGIETRRKISMSLRHSYTIIAPLYDALLATAGGGLRAASLAQLPQQATQDILISGIGTGLDLPHLPPGHTYTGLDLTAAMLERAKPRIGNLHLNLVQGDSMALPFAGTNASTMWCCI